MAHKKSRTTEQRRKSHALDVSIAVVSAAIVLTTIMINRELIHDWPTLIAGMSLVPMVIGISTLIQETLDYYGVGTGRIEDRKGDRSRWTVWFAQGAAVTIGSLVGGYAFHVGVGLEDYPHMPGTFAMAVIVYAAFSFQRKISAAASSRYPGQKSMKSTD